MYVALVFARMATPPADRSLGPNARRTTQHYTPALMPALSRRLPPNVNGAVMSRLDQTSATLSVCARMETTSADPHSQLGAAISLAPSTSAQTLLLILQLQWTVLGGATSRLG